ncbi:MAG: hypothetical protein ACO1PI_04615 [Bacteroidota bacterium]
MKIIVFDMLLRAISSIPDVNTYQEDLYWYSGQSFNGNEVINIPFRKVNVNGTLTWALAVV